MEKFDGDINIMEKFETSNFSIYFSGSCIPTNESFLFIDTTYSTLARDFIFVFEYEKVGKRRIIFIIKPQ